MSMTHYSVLLLTMFLRRLQQSVCRLTRKCYITYSLVFCFVCLSFILYSTNPNGQIHQDAIGDGSLTTTKGKTFEDFEFKGYADNPDWLEVMGSGGRLYVYAAYEDIRVFPSVVRIVSIRRRGYEAKSCILVYDDGSTTEVTSVMSDMNAGWNLAFTASYITCKLPSGRRPTGVAISVENGDPKTRLLLRKFPIRGKEKFMSVCVKPFHYNYNRALWLVEFVEFHRLLGVTHFYFYNDTIGKDVNKVLKSYVDDGVATVLQWTLPVISQKEIRTEGIFAALNDCNLRSVGNFRYAMFIDTDEFIVPRTHSNYTDLLNFLGRDVGAYIFQNAFYYLYWNNDTTVHNLLYANGTYPGGRLFGSEHTGPYLLTAYKTNRLTTFHRHYTRSKYIAAPWRTLECGNHRVWRFVNKEDRDLKVSKYHGLSHHYRICEFGGFSCLDKPHVVDRRAHHWLLPLVEKVAQACGKGFPLTGACPEAPPLGSPW